MKLYGQLCVKLCMQGIDVVRRSLLSLLLIQSIVNVQLYLPWGRLVRRRGTIR